MLESQRNCFLSKILEPAKGVDILFSVIYDPGSQIWILDSVDTESTWDLRLDSPTIHGSFLVNKIGRRCRCRSHGIIIEGGHNADDIKETKHCLTLHTLNFKNLVDASLKVVTRHSRLLQALS